MHFFVIKTDICLKKKKNWGYFVYDTFEEIFYYFNSTVLFTPSPFCLIISPSSLILILHVVVVLPLSVLSFSSPIADPRYFLSRPFIPTWNSFWPSDIFESLNKCISSIVLWHYWLSLCLELLDTYPWTWLPLRPIWTPHPSLTLQNQREEEEEDTSTGHYSSNSSVSALCSDL